MGSVRFDGCDLYYEELGEGTPILLIHPSGATASAWGSAREDLARTGRVITYDRRGYARSAGAPVRSVAVHAADAVAILESLATDPAVLVGTSAGATIAIDVAVRRPDLVRAVVAHEAPWRLTRHLPTPWQAGVFARIGWLALRGRRRDAAETLLRAAYAYRDGGSAWDAFPDAWRRAGRDNAPSTLRDLLATIGDHPSATDLAGVEVPIVCTYGARSPDFMVRYTRSLTSAIPGARMRWIDGAAHAAPFDAPANFVRAIAEAVAATDRPAVGPR